MRLDISDTNIFSNPADPGEWAITETFTYIDIDCEDLNSEEKIAYKSGWLGLDGFGRSTLVCVSVIMKLKYQHKISRFAVYIFSQFEASGILEALQAELTKISDMAILCNHPT